MYKSTPSDPDELAQAVLRWQKRQQKEKEDKARASWMDNEQEAFTSLIEDLAHLEPERPETLEIPTTPKPQKPSPPPTPEKEITNEELVETFKKAIVRPKLPPPPPPPSPEPEMEMETAQKAKRPKNPPPPSPEPEMEMEMAQKGKRPKNPPPPPPPAAKKGKRPTKVEMEVEPKAKRPPTPEPEKVLKRPPPPPPPPIATLKVVEPKVVKLATNTGATLLPGMTMNMCQGCRQNLQNRIVYELPGEKQLIQFVICKKCSDLNDRIQAIWTP